ncbi:MAG: class III poly(R)-hydroxyalkanoic acid synthase subunit PhaC [Phycisphaerae bacterium]
MSASSAMWDTWIDGLVNESVSTARRAARVPFLYSRAQRVRKGVTPSEVVYEEDRLRLLRYESSAIMPGTTPLIVVFALVNRPYILDLKENKSVISHFVRRGFDTYLVDWGVPTSADRQLALDDYINGYLLNCVEHVRERTGSKKVSLLGYCMGGTMSSIFTALQPTLVRNLMLMAAGIDFSTRSGLLNLWTDSKYFDVDKFIDAFGNCPAEFLQSAFLMLKPVSNMIEKPLNFCEKMGNPDFVDDFLTMESWLNDNIPVAGETFREFVKYLYQQNRLVKGTMPVGRHVVNLRNITCPILNIVASKDDLVPCEQSLPFNALVGSTDRATKQIASGHIGLAVGSKAQRELWPDVVQWLVERSGTEKES